MYRRPGKYDYKNKKKEKKKNPRQQTSKEMNKKKKKKKERTAQNKSLRKGKLNSIANWKASSTFPLNFTHSLSLSVCLSHAWRAFLALFSPALRQSHECMSHMPHSHDIAGPGSARGTFHSQGLLLYIVHKALEPCQARKEYWAAVHPFRSGSGSWLFHWRTMYILWLCLSWSLRWEIVYWYVQKVNAHTQSSRQSFTLVRSCLLENNNVSLSFKPSNQPLEGQSDQIDLWL